MDLEKWKLHRKKALAGGKCCPGPSAIKLPRPVHELIHSHDKMDDTSRRMDASDAKIFAADAQPNLLDARLNASDADLNHSDDWMSYSDATLNGSDARPNASDGLLICSDACLNASVARISHSDGCPNPKSASIFTISYSLLTFIGQYLSAFERIVAFFCSVKSKA